MSLTYILKASSSYQFILNKCLSIRAPDRISCLGNPDLLQRKLLGIFCSVRCPGKLILQTYDLMQELRQAGVPVIGGFHSPMEQECLTIILRGSQPITVCPARSLEGMKIRREFREPLKQGRMLFLSPFPKKLRRPTVQMALYRNQIVAALSEAVFIAYAEPQGKTEQFCREILSLGKSLYTLDNDANASLIALGAKPILPNDISPFRQLTA
jgi:predicted Rossmann fold nucleotide-binding protein DprA/Smf involved in DNA uptake